MSEGLVTALTDAIGRYYDTPENPGNRHMAEWLCDDGGVVEALSIAAEEGLARAWDDAVAHVARVAQVGSSGLNAECFEGNPHLSLPPGQATP